MAARRPPGRGGASELGGGVCPAVAVAVFGVAATDDAVFFAWQDTRNAIGQTDSEDIYASSIPLNGSAVLVRETKGIPGWTLFFAGALGLGLGSGIAWLVARSRPDAAPTPAGVPNLDPRPMGV